MASHILVKLYSFDVFLSFFKFFLFVYIFLFETRISACLLDLYLIFVVVLKLCSVFSDSVSHSQHGFKCE